MMTRTPQERDAYYSALESRCKHLEETIYCASNLLRVIIHDFDTPVLKSFLEPIIERLNSVIAYLEASSASAPSSNGHCSRQE